MSAASEDELLRDLDDEAAWLQYGEELVSRGDPQGELVAVQAALAHQPESDALRAREQRLFDTHKREWIGGIPEDGQGCTLTWRYGFVNSIAVRHDWLDVGHTAAELVRRLLESPAGRFLREIVTDGQRTFHYEALVGMLATAQPRSLQGLELLHEEHSLQRRYHDLGDLGRLWTAAPGLRRLVLRGAKLRLGDIRAPELRQFHVCSRVVEYIDALASARWPLLDNLQFDLSLDTGEAMALLDPILAGRGLAALRHLGLKYCSFGDALCRALTTAPLASQLQTLDLSATKLTPAGARALHENREAFPRLRRLVVSQHRLGASDKALLSKVYRDVLLDDA